MRSTIVGIVALAGMFIVVYTKFCIFVVQPIGAVPEGRTMILWRRSAVLNFIDSADGICLREQKGVSLICRIGALAGVVGNNPILLRLPYSQTLYLVSTDGAQFDR